MHVFKAKGYNDIRQLESPIGLAKAERNVPTLFPLTNVRTPTELKAPELASTVELTTGGH